MKKFLLSILFFTVTLCCAVYSVDLNGEKTDALIKSVGTYIYETVKSPSVGTVGGDWAVIGLSRSNIDVPREYFENYYLTVEEYIKKRKGILHEKKYTEYSRVILAVTSIGKDPENIAGYNLLTPLSDYEKTVWQGINGPIWALIALDCGNYELPKNTDAKIHATREMYIDYILEKQNTDGGWALNGVVSEPDVTAMALQALSAYQSYENVNSAISKALDYLSCIQNNNGCFLNNEEENSESNAQILVALCSLGISVNDDRFVKNGKNVLDGIMKFNVGSKGFKHTIKGDVNQMSTEQCFYSLVALLRFINGKNSLYNMTDSPSFPTTSVTERNGKSGDIKVMPVIYKGKTFADINGSAYKVHIETLAERGIINGKSENLFDPESTMTRAEFAAIIARGLGLPIKSVSAFGDVIPSDWFYTYVNTAYYYGIINGVSSTEFNPGGTITREEAATMIARAARLCGHDTEFTTSEVRDALAAFSDYVNISEWSRTSLAFCYSNDILDNSVLKTEPKEAVTRAEVAYMLCNMLNISKLL